METSENLKAKQVLKEVKESGGNGNIGKGNVILPVVLGTQIANFLANLNLPMEAADGRSYLVKELTKLKPLENTNPVKPEPRNPELGS